MEGFLSLGREDQQRLCAMAAARTPYFFKVFIPHLTSHQLVIPIAFLKHLERESSQTSTLIGPSGNKWNVELIRRDDVTVFGNGWGLFVADHSLVVGDFLLFRYEGRSCFTVLIFDTSACEKEAAFLVMPNREATIDHGKSVDGVESAGVKANEVAVVGPKRKGGSDDSPNKRQKNLKCSTMASKKSKSKCNRDLVIQWTTMFKRRGRGKAFPPENTTDSGGDNHVGMPPVEEGPSQTIEARGRKFSQPKENVVERRETGKALPHRDSTDVGGDDQQQKSHAEDDVGAPPVGEGPSHTFEGRERELLQREEREPIRIADRKSKKKPLDYYSNTKKLIAKVADMPGESYSAPLKSQRRPVTQEELIRALEKSKSFKSLCPSVALVMRDSYCYHHFQLNLPYAFAKEHLPTVNMKMTLWDPEGRPWTVAYLFYRRRAGLRSGWNKFSFANNLESGDVCIFELIKRAEMQVHIFRVVDKIVPLVRFNPRNNSFRDRVLQ